MAVKFIGGEKTSLFTDSFFISLLEDKIVVLKDDFLTDGFVETVYKLKEGRFYIVSTFNHTDDQERLLYRECIGITEVIVDSKNLIEQITYYEEYFINNIRESALVSTEIKIDLTRSTLPMNLMFYLLPLIFVVLVAVGIIIKKHAKESSLNYEIRLIKEYSDWNEEDKLYFCSNKSVGDISYFVALKEYGE